MDVLPIHVLLPHATYPEHPSALTEREWEIIHLLLDGWTTREIADKLFLSPFTVETHRRNIRRKTGARNMADMIITLLALRNRLVQVQEGEYAALSPQTTSPSSVTHCD